VAKDFEKNDLGTRINIQRITKGVDAYDLLSRKVKPLFVPAASKRAGFLILTQRIYFTAPIIKRQIKILKKRENRLGKVYLLEGGSKMALKVIIGKLLFRLLLEIVSFLMDLI
jgi:hypothetical protein